MARALAILAALLAVVVARAPAAEASYQPPRVGLENRVWGSSRDSAENATLLARQPCECIEAFRLLRAGITSGSVVFLQREPSGYRDSVSLYAGFANDAVNNRDPTGRFIPLLIGACAANPVCAGAVIGAGVAAGAQLYDLFANGNVRSNGEIAEGLAIGAVAGVVGAAAGGVAAAGATRVGLGTVATGAISGAAAGAAGGSTARSLSGGEVTVGTVLLDSSVGAGLGAAFGTASALSQAGDDIADDVAGAGRPGAIVLGRSPTRAQVIEELMHLGQHRRLGFRDLDPQDIVRLENRGSAEAAQARRATGLVFCGVGRDRSGP